MQYVVGVAGGCGKYVKDNFPSKVLMTAHAHTHTLTQVGGDKVRPALTLVGYEEELRPAMSYVFGSMFVCDTLQNAKKVRDTHQLVNLLLSYSYSQPNQLLLSYSYSEPNWLLLSYS